jgi:hypothetical protein
VSATAMRPSLRVPLVSRYSSRKTWVGVTE